MARQFEDTKVHRYSVQVPAFMCLPSPREATKAQLKQEKRRKGSTDPGGVPYPQANRERCSSPIITNTVQDLRSLAAMRIEMDYLAFIRWGALRRPVVRSWKGTGAEQIFAANPTKPALLPLQIELLTSS
jgi:hypothetical protein